MDFSLVVIGDEILLGQVTDTNSGYIARALAPEQWHLRSIYTVGDDAAQIEEAVQCALAESTLVITTGGLGPTKDDITKATLMKIFGGKLYRDPAITSNIERIFARRGLALNPLTADQALVPDSCRVIQNLYGTAPIMWFEREGKVLIAMPGVPFETEGMIDGAVGEAIRAYFKPDVYASHHTIIAGGISESALAMKLSAFEDSMPACSHLAYLPNPGYIRLRIDVLTDRADESEQIVARLAEELRKSLGDNFICDGDYTPAGIVLERTRQHGYSLSTAESCTGGNIAHRITEIPGSSDVYVGSIVSYSNSVKTGVLNVNSADLLREGAVSEPVVRAMAEGVCKCLGTDCSVATSGIAGPGGGSEEKPVGTVWIAAHTPKGTVSRLLHLPGNRARVIDRATTEALLLLAAEL